MKDLETLFTTVYVLVDDQYKRILKEYPRLRTSGPEPEFSDSEVITLALMAELTGNDSENAWIPYVTKNYRYLFPQIIERSRYNRRVKDLTNVIDKIRCSFRESLVGPMPFIQIIDSVPLPVCHYARASRCRSFGGEAAFGVCESKHEKIYGFKTHMTISEEGVPLSFSIASANHHDVTLVWDLVDHCWNIILIGDKGYIDKEQNNEFKETRGITVLTHKRVNQKEQNSKWLNSFISNSRQIIETVFSQLTDQFNISKNRAKKFFGLISRVVRKITAYTSAIYINKLYNLPLLEVKNLVF